MNIISGVEWDVKAGVPIKVIGGNANELAYVRASELIEGSWSSVFLRDECDENSSVTFIGFSF